MRRLTFYNSITFAFAGKVNKVLVTVTMAPQSIVVYCYCTTNTLIKVLNRFKSKTAKYGFVTVSQMMVDFISQKSANLHNISN